MKKSLVLINVALFISVFMTDLSFAQKKVLELATGEWPPYTSEKLKDGGFVTKYYKEIVRDMGYEPKITWVPWKRVGPMIKNGEIFGAFPYTPTDERRKFANFSLTTNYVKNVFFYNKKRLGTIAPKSWEALKAYKVVSVAGSYPEDFYKKAGLKVYYITNFLQGFRMISEGRNADILNTVDLVGWDLINNNLPDKKSEFSTFSFVDKKNPLTLMISPKFEGSAELQKKFNESIKRVQEKKMLEGILKEYGLQQN